jgi:hypothetical protein
MIFAAGSQEKQKAATGSTDQADSPSIEEV